MECYLRFENEYLDDAERCDSIAQAKRSFMRTAEELDRYGQQIEATIHLRDERIHDEPKCGEYPSFVLSLGPRGGLKCEAT